MRIYRRTFSVSVGAYFGGRQDFFDFHLERPCQDDQLGVRDATKLRLDFGERAPAQIPTAQRAAGGEHRLRQFLLVTQLPDLRPDNVLRFRHAPKTELDSSETRELNCSNIGAT